MKELTDRAINIITAMYDSVNEGEKHYTFTYEDIAERIRSKEVCIRLPTRHAIIAVKFAIGELAAVGKKHDLDDLLHELDRINSYINEPDNDYDEVLEIKREGNEDMFGNADGKIINVRKSDSNGRLKRTNILIKLV